MDYKITFLTLRIIPETNVNREEFYRGILKALSLERFTDKFVNPGGNKYYFSKAVYNGISIKLPYYETMFQQGFVLEISGRGIKFLTGYAEHCGTALLELLFDTFLPTSDVSVIRIDIETDYIPPHILKKIPPEYLKSNATLYIGPRKSNFSCMYSKNIATYISRNRYAAFISDELLCNNYYGFGVSFSGFLYDWKPHLITFNCITEAPPELRD